MGFQNLGIGPEKVVSNGAFTLIFTQIGVNFLVRRGDALRCNFCVGGQIRHGEFKF